MWTGWSHLGCSNQRLSLRMTQKGDVTIKVVWNLSFFFLLVPLRNTVKSKDGNRFISYYVNHLTAVDKKVNLADSVIKLWTSKISKSSPSFCAFKSVFFLLCLIRVLHLVCSDKRVNFMKVVLWWQHQSAGVAMWELCFVSQYLDHITWWKIIFFLGHENRWCFIVSKNTFTGKKIGLCIL